MPPVSQTSLLGLADDIRNAENVPEVKAEEQDDKLTLYHDKWPVLITDDYYDFIQFFGYDPDHWEVESQGTMSKWQQSKGNKDGTRDIVWLYSYKGVKFRRIRPEDILTEKQFEEAVTSAREWPSSPLVRRTLGSPLQPPVTYVHHIGDTQAGKGEGGGLEGLDGRLVKSLEATIEDIKYHQRAGAHIEAIVDAHSGDIVENIFGHYETQTITTATMRAQYAFAVETEIRRLKALSEFGLPIIIPRTPSNHGEHRTSVGGRSITTESDNLDLQIAESVKRVLEETPLKDQLEWIIPHDDPLTKFTASGVNMVLTHGHKIERNTENGVVALHHAMVNEGYNAKVFLLGHKHHFIAKELGCGTSMIQNAALDGGSPYYFNMTGKQNSAGVIGFLAGQHYKLGYSHITLL